MDQKPITDETDNTPANGETQPSDEQDRAKPDDEAEPEWTNGDDHLNMPGEEQDDERPPLTISVLLHASADEDKDRRKLSRIHNAFIKYPGNDRFVIVIQRGETSFPLNFPHLTTQVCNELQQDLQAIVGSQEFITIDGDL